MCRCCREVQAPRAMQCSKTSLQQAPAAPPHAGTLALRACNQHPASPSMTTQFSWCVALLQGRARPTLAQLYNWRYRQLGNLPNVETGAVGLPCIIFSFSIRQLPPPVTPCLRQRLLLLLLLLLCANCCIRCVALEGRVVAMLKPDPPDCAHCQWDAAGAPSIRFHCSAGLPATLYPRRPPQYSGRRCRGPQHSESRTLTPAACSPAGLHPRQPGLRVRLPVHRCAGRPRRPRRVGAGALLLPELGGGGVPGVPVPVHAVRV